MNRKWFGDSFNWDMRAAQTKQSIEQKQADFDSWISKERFKALQPNLLKQQYDSINKNIQNARTQFQVQKYNDLVQLQRQVDLADKIGFPSIYSLLGYEKTPVYQQLGEKLQIPVPTEKQLQRQQLFNQEQYDKGLLGIGNLFQNGVKGGVRLAKAGVRTGYMAGQTGLKVVDGAGQVAGLGINALQGTLDLLDSTGTGVIGTGLKLGAGALAALGTAYLANKAINKLRGNDDQNLVYRGIQRTGKRAIKWGITKGRSKAKQLLNDSNNSLVKLARNVIWEDQQDDQAVDDIEQHQENKKNKKRRALDRQYRKRIRRLERLERRQPQPQHQHQHQHQ